MLGQLWRVISQPNLGALPIDIEATDVAEAGWGVVFHHQEDRLVKAALKPLIAHRRKMGKKAKVNVLEYRTDESLAQWLARHDVSIGNIDPSKVPFYLMLIGSPEKIPFVFGHLLSVEYAVGRVCFDTTDEYARYVASVIAYETDAKVSNAREAVFFAPRHDFDRSTQISADLLVNPLADGVPAKGHRPAEPSVATRYGNSGHERFGEGRAAATRAALSRILAPAAGTKTPAFLFTASHGVGFPKGHPDQVSKQGALLCQDWRELGKISPKHYFSAADLPPKARVKGLVSFHFACFSAGTPKYDRFLHDIGVPPPAIAERAFFAALSPGYSP